MFKYLLVLISALFLAVPAYAGQDVVLALEARTATTTSANLVKSGETGVHIILNVTAVPGVVTLTPKIQGMDALGNYYDILVGTASATTGLVVLKVAPGITAVANAAAADVLPSVYRVIVTHSGAGSFTYSVTANR